jgi:diguanylate cyclase (GGDEF)-like protein/PAS domain S-box-containing protein
LTVSDPSQPDNPLIYANDAFEEITGYSKDEALGRNCRFLQGEETDPEKISEMRTAIENEEPSTVRIKNYRKNGDPFWNRVSITPVRDDDGEVTHFVGVQQDVTEYKEIEELLEYRATYDDMTGLINRETLLERFSDERERLQRYDRDLSFLLLDLDHFKEINDNHGHHAGDTVLQRVGQIIQDQIRNSDIGGRYGGEEFGIVLPETELERAQKLARRLREKISQSRVESPDGATLQVTASIGLSTMNEDDTSDEELIKRADKAMYHAKEQGRDRVECYKPERA